MAVIDIGASSIRMAIAEIGEDGVKILERLVQGVSLGKDTFATRTIRRKTIESCVQVLRAYQRKLSEYQINDPKQIRVVATSAVREASNRMAFLDRIQIATGLVVNPIDDAEIARITYLGIQPLLRGQPNPAQTTVIVEVGGGSTDVLVLRDGDVVHSHTYRLGSLRLRETIESFSTAPLKVRAIMENHIDRTIELIRPHVAGDSVQLLALGGDVRFALSQLETPDPQVPIRELQTDTLSEFADQMLALSVDRIIDRFHLTLPDAESLGPALLVCVRMARALNLKTVHVTDFTLRSAVLNQMASREAWSDEFNRQIMNSARELGRHYRIDDAHAMHVSSTAQTLYHSLETEHRLPPRFELILRVAAILHETGLFINSRACHKHSYYLIVNSEIFGLSSGDLQLVALVARYHRRAMPKPNHEGYSLLSRHNRIAVRKLAAILRIADALDHSRSQRIHSPQCEVQDGTFVISVPGIDDLSLEQLELRQKSGLFLETYGLQVLLRRVA